MGAEAEVGGQTNGAATSAPGPDAVLDRPDPDFEIVSAVAVPRAATPTISFSLEVTDTSGIPIHFIALSVLITIEPGMRTYDPADRERLVELFGEPERWGSTTGAFRWTQVDVVVPAFTGHRAFDVPIHCTYDHEVAATKYLGGPSAGTYPLQFHFNGTTYYEGEGGNLQMLPLAWDRSARYELPVEVWSEMIDAHYPDGSWLHLERDTLSQLSRHKASTGAPTLDASIRGLLAGADD